MTESEAKTKWCPFARVMTGDVDSGLTFPPGNRAAVRERGELRVNENPETCRCIASACMAWRRYLSPEMHREGYCGLAGSQ